MNMNTRFSLLMVWALMLPTMALAETGLVNPNLADKDELQALPNVDDETAQAIIDGRPYLSATDLDTTLAVAMDGEQRQALYARLFRPIDLNNASAAEILLIPAMSRKMAHEFEEYRPYRSMEQFRREIGKYVDDAEVARLEQYVFIPVDLNSASDVEIMQIPGMSKRMAHEFEEYRPYESMEQFRREIGKYVDDDEVARLESYVILN
jgi:DNA uptake protein ComE-like DNA-binding protein